MSGNFGKVANVSFEQLLALVGPRMWQKATELAGRVSRIEWGNGTVSGKVFESGKTYGVTVSIPKINLPNQHLHWDCECEDGIWCAHGVALLLSSLSSANWQEELEALSGTSPIGEEGDSLAVCFDLKNRQKGLSLRPLRKSEEGWSDRALNWRQIASTSRAAIPTGMNETHLAALHELCLKAHMARPQTGLILISLGTGAIPALRELLGRGVQIFVGAQDLRPVKFVQGGHCGIDVRAQEKLTLQVGLQLEDEFYPAPEVWLGPACALLPRRGLLVSLSGMTIGPLRWLDTAKPVTIPKAQVGEFRSHWLPQLKLAYEVFSSDQSMALNIAAEVSIGLAIDLSEDEATLSWKLRKEWPEETQEDELLHVPSDLTQTWEQIKQIVPDIDKKTLTVPELAAWKRQVIPTLEDIGISISFNEAAQEAHLDNEKIHVTFAGTSNKDWLDLKVRVLIGDAEIPLGTLFAALDSAMPALRLPDGRWVDLSGPELQKLRDLIEEAKLLRPGEEGLLIPKTDVQWIKRARQLGDFTMGQVPCISDDIRPVEEVPGLRVKLRNYQSYGVSWLAHRMQNAMGGILADDMGLGKTVQLLSAIKLSRTEGTVLVVAPTSVVATWVHEAERFLPDLNVASVQTTARRRNESLSDMAQRADILVTTYTLVRLEAERYAKLGWAGLILDEAQAVKNSDTATFKALQNLNVGWCFAVTGTPIENSLSDLHSLTSLALPGLLPSARQFRSKVVLPVEKDGEELPLQAVRARVEPHFLRRTKEEVATDLPPKSEQVLEVELVDQHRHLYDKLLTRERSKALGLIDDPSARVSLLSSLTKIRLMAIDASLVQEQANVPSAKTEALIQQLSQIIPSGHKALVFSQFTKYLKRVRAQIEAAGMKTSYLDGATTNRPRAIAQFSEGDAQVFCISLRAGGTGLTLTEADYVYIMDPWWNPAVEEQAIDRAHRLGQTKPVNVYRLVATDTVEQKVMELKERKQQLLGQVFGASGQNLDTADIAQILGIAN